MIGMLKIQINLQSDFKKGIVKFLEVNIIVTSLIEF